MNRHFALAVLLALLGGCAAPPPRAMPDPLPQIFPVRFELPAVLPGFERVSDQASADPYVGQRQNWRSSTFPQLEVGVQVHLAGVYVDAAEALAVLVGRSREQLAASLADGSAELLEDRALAALPAPAGQALRPGRRLRLRLGDSPDALLDTRDLYFADPYAVVLRSRIPADQAGTLGAELDRLGGALVAALRVDPAVLCGPPAVLRTWTGLSNVSSNGRVLLLSEETDNPDASTLAQLQRLAARQRERAGCPVEPADHSAVERELRRSSRSW